MGVIYVEMLSDMRSAARLAAVADVDEQVCNEIAGRHSVPRSFVDPYALLEERSVDAVIISSPTKTHADLVTAACRSGKAILCEKPLAISLQDAETTRDVVRGSGTFFQMGFMRRFDPGYASMKDMLSSGRVGFPVMFKSTSRDQSPPPMEFMDPSSSGGLILDMGIHDLDLARWFCGEVKSVSAVGSCLACPALADINDSDSAVVSLVFESGALGLIDLCRSGVYGYDVHSELLCSNGTIRTSSLRRTNVEILEEGTLRYDTASSFAVRFADAYKAQLREFLRSVAHDEDPDVTIDDGVESLRIAEEATRSLKMANS